MLETLGVQGFKSAALGAVVMHDSRDNEDMPTRGWFLNLNNLAYREGARRRGVVRRVPRRPAGLLAARRRPRPRVQAVQLAHGRRAVGGAGHRRAARLQARASTWRRTCRRSKPRSACPSARDGARRCSPASRACTARAARRRRTATFYPTVGARHSLRHQAGAAHAGQLRVRAGRRGQPRRLPEVRLRLVDGFAARNWCRR